MRVRHWIFVGLCCALGTLQALGVTYNYHVHNGGGSDQAWYIHEYYQGSYSGQIGYATTVAGATTDASASLSGSTASVVWKLFSNPGNVLLDQKSVQYVTSGTVEVGTFQLYSTPPTTNYYCYYHVQWTNTGPTFAVPEMAIVYTSGPWSGTVLYPTNFNLTLLSPGSGVDFWHTNWIGTNSAPGCGSLIFGDSRPNATVSVTEVNGSMANQVDSGQPPGTQGSGNQAGSGGDLVGINTNAPGGKAGGTTNLATQHDIFVLANANQAGLAQVERSVAGVGTNINLLTASMATNFSGLSKDVKGVGTNVTASGSNVVGAINSLGTNLAGMSTNGNGTNLDLSGVAGELTNIFNQTSNHQAAVQSGLNDWYTNLQSYTNLYNDWSNVAAGVAGDVGTIRGWGDGIGDGLRAGITGLSPVEDADADFLVLQIPKPGVYIPFGPPPPPGDQYYRLDMKSAISLQFIEDRFSGFRYWFKEIVIWFTLIWLVMRYMEELRQALFEVLAIPPPGMSLVKQAPGVVGAMTGTPLGFALGKAAGITLSAAQLIALIAVIAFFPSFLVAMMTTVATDVGHGPVWIVTAITEVVAGPGKWLNRFLYYTSPWFPAVELMIFAANYLAVRLGINGTVSLMLVYRKVQTYVECT